VSVLHGPEPPAWFVGDGCTMSPDGWWREACRYHDWAYWSTKHGATRWEADWWFLKNLLILRVPLQWALWYWLGVRVFGRKHYRKKSHG
jgi:hypothetical protein